MYVHIKNGFTICIFNLFLLLNLLECKLRKPEAVKHLYVMSLCRHPTQIDLCTSRFSFKFSAGLYAYIFHKSKSQKFRGTVKVQFFNECNISVRSRPEVALPEVELGKAENWKKQCEMSHFFMISRMIPKFWTNIKSFSRWREFFS